MDLLKNVGILLIGFILLVKGADFFVDGSSNVAKKLRIPSLIVGLTIVAMGTSLPELAVSLTAAVEGSNSIAISNVVGSNLFNLVVVLGACAILCPIVVDKKVMKVEYPFSIIVTVILVLLASERTLFGQPGYDNNISGNLGRLNGVMLLIIFIAFMVYTVLTALKERKNIQEEKAAEDELPVVLCLIYIVGGIAAIKFGGDFVVTGARAIAAKMGMTETLIGLTIVAVGTSLPELVTSVVAARKGETGLAIGNVIGSNIFNILLILGVSSAISPIAMGMDSFIDTSLLIAINIIVYVFAWSRDKISKKEGLYMILIYAVYMVYAILR